MGPVDALDRIVDRIDGMVERSSIPITERSSIPITECGDAIPQVLLVYVS